MRYVLLLLALVTATGAFGQKIRFTDTSNRWTFLQCNFSDGTHQNYTSPVATRWTGDSLLNGVRYLKQGPLLLREDTALETLFFRFNQPGMDTAEQVYFRYSLRPGDTLWTRILAQVQMAARVERLDSIRIGTVYHRLWVMTPAAVLPNGRWSEPYRFLEGVGCTNGFQVPVSVHGFEDASSLQLRCFTSRGAQPPCTPGVAVPGCRGPVDQLSGYRMVDSFNNAGSCTFTRVGIAQPAGAAQELRIYPNPASGAVTVSFPAGHGGGWIRICNVVGVECYRQSVARGESTRTVSTASWPSGTYTVEWTDGNGARRIQKLVH